MKKLLALVLALILGFIGTIGTRNNVTNPIDQAEQTEAAKLTEWAHGYAARCKATVNKNRTTDRRIALRHIKREMRRAMKRAGHIAMMALCLPLLPLMGVAGHGGASTPKYTVDRCARNLTELYKERRALKEAYAEAEAAYDVSKAMLLDDELLGVKEEIARQKDKLKAIAAGKLGASPATQVYAAAMLQAKPWVEHLPAERKPGTRTILKVAKRERAAFKYNDIGILIEVLSWHDKDGWHGYRAAIEAAANDDDVAAKKAVEEIEQKLRELACSKNPIRVKAKSLTLRTGMRSLMSDLLGVREHRFTERFVTGNYDMTALVNNKTLRTMVGLNAKDGKRRLKAIEEQFIQILMNQGIKVYDNKIHVLHGASNGMQKTGDGYFCEKSKIAEIEKDLGEVIPGFRVERTTSGAQILKERANMWTPSVPIVKPGTNGEQFLTVLDLVLMPSVKREQRFDKALKATQDGLDIVRNHIETLTMFDGSMWVNPTDDPEEAARRALIMSAQLRFAGGKGCLHNAAESAKYAGQLKDVVNDIDGTQREWKKFALSATADVWKWDKMGLSWHQMQEALVKLSTKYPTIHAIREVRRVNSADETERQMSWQLVQQMLFANDNELSKLAQKGVERLRREMKASGALVRYAGLRKQPEDRSMFERIFELLPELISEKHMSGDRERRWTEDFCEQAIKPVLDRRYTGYPFIATDPVAYWEIVFGGADPNRNDLGILKPGEINIPDTEDDTDVLINRCPSNMVCAILRKQKNHTAYEDLGNVAVFAYGDVAFVIMDADEDGDEVSTDTNPSDASMFKKTLNRPCLPILFAHDKGGNTDIHTAAERNAAIAEALTNANMFGELVGKFSNASKAWLAIASNAVFDASLKPSDREAIYQHAMEMATWCNIGTILAIDLVKTGSFQDWLEDKLNTAAKAGGQPWCQRLNKADLNTPWDDWTWDGDETHRPKTKRESLATIDRLARITINGTNGGHYHYDDEGMPCTEETLQAMLCHDPELMDQIPAATIDKRLIASIEIRNYKQKEDKVIEDAKAGKPVALKDLVVFLWRNAAALRYTCRNSDELTANNTKQGDLNPADMQEFYDFCRAVIMSYGLEPSGNSHWNRLTNEQKRQSKVNAILRMAFEMPFKNGNPRNNRVGDNEKTELAKWGKKGSLVRFILNVLAVDVVANVEENTGVPQEERVAVPDADAHMVLVGEASLLDFMTNFSSDAKF